MKCALLAIIVLNLLSESTGFNFNRSNINLYVYENAPINSTVGQITFQNDSSYYPVFQIVEDDGSFSLFINASIISIVVNKPLDADSGNPQHVFMIQEKTSEKGINVVINILNVNDNAPRFPQNRIYFIINEPMFNGQQVGQMRATDLDNDIITYSFNASASPVDTSKFFINRNTGIITPKSIPSDSSIDAEKSQFHVLQVLATDQGQLTGSIWVNIIVFDLNDNTNKFSQTQYSFVVDENAEIGTVVGKVSSIDNDISSTNSNITYYILSGIYNDIFTIDPNTGMIIVNGKIDFEVQKQYGLPVCATDKQTLFTDARANCTFVQINVINLNDNLPTISPVNYFLTLSEKQVTNLAYQFLGVDADGSKPTFEFNTSLTSSVVMKLFNLNPATGLLTLNGKKFDYDDPDKVNLPYFVYVVVRDSEAPFKYGGSSRLIIGVKDTNDNSPIFDNSSYLFTVNENSVIGTVIGNVNATDLDKTASPRLYFELNNRYANTIKVDQVTGTLTVVGVLDYESLAFYYLTICATDQALDVTQTFPANEQRVGCTFVTIAINDLNDNLPYFENLLLSIDISEKSPTGLKVFTFFPKDKDSNSVNTLQCILNNTYTDSRRFSLDQNTCVLTVSAVGLIDYEEKKQFDLYVNPYDGTNFGTETHLIIYLIDVNDNSPQFSSSVYFFKIDENSAFNTTLGNVFAIDNDVTASNNQVNYFILNNQSPFGILSSGIIYVKSPVDYEITAYYNLSVCASDNAIDYKQLNPSAESRIGCAIVNIEVNNLNDNKPVFTQKAFSVNIEEKILTGTSILKLTAFDADGVSPKFIYNYTAMSSTTLSKFNLSENGDIIVTGVIDYEEGIQTFVLVVLLVDGADGQVSTSTNVNIYLSDVNDNSPVFTNVYHFSVKEGASPGTPVGTVLATDPDILKLTYFIMNTQSLFELDSVSGTITVSKGATISYKALEYLLTVCATDNYIDAQEWSPSNEKRTTCTVVTITIESETLPKFVGGNFSIQILSSTSINKMIFQFFVNNRYGSIVIFAFNASKTSQEAMSLFGIDSKNGIIFVSNNLNIATQKTYVIYVIAQDNNTLVTDDEAMLTISIVDNNNNFPLFSIVPYVFRFNNNESIGYFVGSVFPTNVNSTILVFNILQSQYSSFFAIDSSGKITLAKTFTNGIGVKSFTVAICAKDSAADYKKDCTAVDIIVQNVMDRFPTPVFAFGSGIISLYEMLAVGTPIFQLAASYSNGIVGYTLNSYTDTFQVDSQTGIVILTKSLNSKIVQKYDLFFTAFDVNNVMVKTDNYQLTVYVFNSSSTGFDSYLYQFQVEENSPNGMVVGTIATVNNQQVSYFILNNQFSNVFSLSNSGGYVQIVVVGSIDREILDKYVLTVCVTDKGSLQGCAQVYISVNDINDNAPVFSSPIYRLTISEKVPIGFVLKKFSATDKDIGVNGLVSYLIDNSTNIYSDSFYLNSTSGELQLSGKFDYELYTSYMLKINAHDSGSPQQSTFCGIVISLTDVNDNSPAFTNGAISTTINENFPINSVVLTVHAEDKDKTLANRQIIYSMPGDDDGYFSINSLTGDIILKKSLDVDLLNNIYYLTVVANDQAVDNTQSNPIAESRIGVEVVTIYVNDINDNSPIFTTGRYIIYVPEDVPVGSVLFQFIANDADKSSIFNTLQYIAIEINSEFLMLNQTSGMLTVKKKFNNQQNFTVVAKARDSGMLESNNVTLVIYVDNVIGNTPRFNQTSYYVNIFENTIIGTKIFTITATDAYSTSLTNNVLYSIVDPESSGIFDINSLGEITIKQPLDREKRERYEFLVVATDTALSLTQSSQACALLTIVIIDVNDNRPVITSSSTTIYLPISISLNSFIFAFTAIDLDSSSNVVFLSADPSNAAWTFFKLDMYSGIINTKSLFDLNSKMEYNLSVVARDSPSSFYLQSDPVTITIKILTDVNHLQFTLLNYPFSIDENMPSGSSVGSVVAFGSSSIEYSISGGIDSLNTFRIDKTSGYISLISSPDFESQSSYTFNVKAHDMMNQKYDAFCIVTVKVNDLNDIWPIIDTVTIGNISENAGPGLVIAVIHVKDMDTSTISENGLTFFISPNNFPVKIIKSYQQAEATVLTIGDFDAEDPNSNSNRFNVTVTDAAGHSSYKEINFLVVDQNDNSPVFSKQFYSFTVFENSPDKTIIGSVVAVDNDKSDIYKTIRYSFSDPLANPNIIIDPISGVISTNGVIDFETMPRYYLNVIATDSFTPTVRKTCAIVIINVGDQNDNAPVFTSATNFSVSEKTVIGTVVFILSAIDADANTKITFYSQMDSTFKITPQGYVILATELDYEQIQQYTFTVVATDNVHNTFQLVTVNVINENDNGPVFFKNFYEAFITENKLSMNKPFLVVTANDGDLPPFNIVTYELIDLDNLGSMFQFYLLDSNGGISYQGTFDREVRELYRFLVKATNAGNPTRSAITYVEVTILDENDYPPIVPSPSYNLTISENTLVNQLVLHIDAKDPNKCANGSIVFSFSPGTDPTESFRIDPKEGDIYVKNGLSYSKQNVYQLLVIVRGCSVTQPLYTYVNVFIYLTEEIGNYPSTLLRISVSENTAINSVVVTTQSMQVWNVNNNQLFYEIVFSDSSDSSVLKINYLTGEVMLIQPLNYEIKNEYIFIRRAVLNGVIYGVQTVSLKIIDENNNNPIFDLPNQPITVSVNEHSQIGSCLTLVNASDADARSRGKLVFSINPPVAGFMIISVKDMGEIFLEKDLNAEEKMLYQLVLSVSDSEGRSSVVSKIINIQVVDINDEPPTFAQSEYIFNKLEGPYQNSFVGTVTATDKDVTPTNKAISYKIVNNDASQVFGIDTLGNIYLKKELDREMVSKYTFMVEAANIINGQKTLVGNCFVNVIVDDTNDHVPTYNGDVSFSFYENVPIGSTLFVIKAEDLDSNPELVYSFDYIGAIRSPISTLGLINVDQVSGRVTLLDSFDYEKATEYIMSVNIYDRSSPQNILNVKFNIRILDVNDNSPRFNVRPQTQLQYFIGEDTPFNYTIAFLTATDNDFGSKINYSLVNVFNNNFAVDQNTGRLYTIGLFDYLVSSQYYLLVVASDNGYPQLSDALPVVVNIIDLNNHNPVFTQTNYNITILQGTPAGLSIGKVSAVDLDSGIYGQVNYFFKSGRTDMFRIDQRTGDIFTLGQVTITSNLIDRYEILVESQDSDPVSPRSSQDVKIIVNAIKINVEVVQPMFYQPYLEIYVREDQPLGVVANTLATVTGGLVNYSIVIDGSQARLGVSKFSIDMQGKISLNSFLDYEQTQFISFSIIAQVIGSNIFGTQNVLVIVQDVDDNIPVFSEPQQQTVTIPSLVNIGIIAFVKANDTDSVSKGKLKFSLINDYGKTFSIISVNDVGLVILNRILIGEPNYLLEVQVQDPAGHTAAQTNLIKVFVNSGQVQFQFTKTLYNFFIPEYFEAGYEVGYVSVFISDSVTSLLSSNTGIEYSIVPAGGAEYIFNVQNNGSIFSKIPYNSKTPYLFSVQANISALGLTAVTWVYVSILPQNKNPIFFSYNKYTLNEDFPTETVIFKVVAIDDSSDVVYSIDQCTGDLLLSINSSTGEVVYKSGLNYAKANTHTCQIRAQDQTMLFATQMITIDVVNVNKYNPIFVPKFTGKKYYNSSIIENSVAIQPVVTVLATDQDSGVFGAVQYSIVNALTSMPFSINPITGSVFTTGVLDYESVKGYEVLIMAADGGSPPRTDVISVLVSVIDINDNFPIFDSLSYTVTVFSNTLVPAIILLVHATDNDVGNLYISYALASGSNNKFSIDEKTGLISLIGTLDYNDISQRYFEIVVTATDYQIGYSSKTSAAIVKINVVEGKNNQIRFVESYKFIELFKNQSVNVVLFTTQVAPSNINISFSIVQGNDNNNFPFLIDSSGSVYLNQTLGSVFQTEFAFFIKAVRVSDQSFSFQSIIVNVLNSDDEKPVFGQPFVRVLNLNTLYTVGQAVSFVTVADNDSSDFVYSITPDNVPFKIANNGYVGILYISEMLVPNSYTFNVSVSDVDMTGKLKNKAENDILYNVIVSSVSNGLITFSQSIYIFKLKEEDSAPKTIGSVYTDSVSPVKFSLVELYLSNIFFVNAITGDITVLKVLDYEATKQYIFTISATNENGYSASTIVNVIVVDVNDNKPLFKGPSIYNAFENTELGSLLFTVFATDQDSGNNSMLIFSLETNVPQIQVNPYSGDVVLVKKLDYESSNKIVFNISVSDQGIPQQTSKQLFTLLIGNLNDHNPVFYSPEDIIISLREDNSIYSDVANASATDFDAGIFGQVFYSLFSTTPMLPFTILPTGIIKQNSTLDYEKIKSYNFFVQASDGGSPPRIAVKAVSINIINVNDNIPFFSQLFYSIAISDQTPIGTVFLQVTAHDYDNGNINYTIVRGGSNSFGIDVQSGSIFVASTLNANLNSYYELLVNASDGGPNMASVKVYINVTSTNQPHFATFVQYISLYENTIPQIIGRSLVVNTNTVTYSLEYTDAGSKFSIDSVSGYIYLIGTLDYEMQKEYVLTVSATNDFYSGYQLVRIIVMDVNDNKPYLTPAAQTVTISEATLTSQPFAFLRAFDADSINKNNLSISISSQFDAFHLDFDNQLMAYLYVKKDLFLLAQSHYTINLIISDGLFATNASVFVNIIPVGQIMNDLQFQSFFYAFQVSELKKPYEIFGIVLATFNQKIPLPISYAIFETDLPFIIDSKTGELSLKTALDYEQTEIFIFHVVASAQDSNQSFVAYSSVVVNVLNANDNGPVFDQPLYVQVVAENYLVGTTVLQVHATDKDIGVNGLMTYSLNVSGVNPFYIDPNTGVVMLSKPLDFESRKSYNITLYATDSQNVGSAQLQVLVLDSNDNAPLFQKLFQTFVVPEQKANVLVGCVVASDYDATTLNNQITYNLLSAGSDYTNAFSVNKSGCIVSSAKLDREIQDKYHLTMVASDNGVPSLSGYTEIVIFVYDVNDNTPKLAHSVYDLQISNLVPTGTLLISLQATDEDLGVNSKISYSIISGNTGSVFSLLSNGDVKTQSSMMNTNITFYQLIIKVEDQGNPALSSIVTLNIAVIGLNIFMPQFDRNVYEVSVNENFVGNIFQVNASIDPSINLTVHYAIVETSLLGKNKLSVDDTGLISIQRAFDYESAPTYIFIVRAFTVIHPEVFTSVVFRLSVNNTNDNSPVFERLSFTVSVARQSKVGTIISTVYAYDADENANSSITYSFQPNQMDKDLFGIDLNSGDIMLLREIQFKDIKVYTLKVFAFDSFGKVSNLPATLVVKIYPDNMFKPTFSASPLYYIVSEGAPLSTFVGSVVAVDNDVNLPSFAILERPEAENYGSIFYSILSSSGSIPFSISSFGVLSVSGPLDRETKSIYDLYVQAIDGGNPGLSSVKLVTVLITDINERPVFVKQNYSIEVMESIPLGFTILAVSAKDSDTFSNGVVNYAIVSGNEDSHFQIDTTTGIISSYDYLNFDKQQYYVLEIKATDRGTQQLTSALNAFVTIKVLKDPMVWQYPFFSVSHYEFVVEENTEKILGRIIATGLQSVSYRILNTNDYALFTINTTTGLLVISNADYETKKELNIYVESYFSFNPNLTSVINVFVTVLDVNDNTPIFILPELNVTISGYTLVGDIVAVFNAFDADSTKNGNVEFGLSQSDIFSISTLSNNTGIIKLNRKLNEAKRVYNLVVSLSDMGIPKRYAPDINFTVFVSNEYTNSLMSLPPGYITINLSTSIGSSIYTLKIQNFSSGQNPLFELVSVFGGLINPFNLSAAGVIKLVRELEPVDRYILFITIKDQSNPSFLATLTFTINISPSVIFSPYFDPSYYSVVVKEDVRIGAVIKKLFVVDPNPFVSLFFQIVSGNIESVFSVNSIGQIVVQKALDAEKITHYSLYVSVADSYGRAETNAIVNIFVTDVNDNAPIFLNSSYYIQVREDILVNTTIETFLAIDPDVSSNGLIQYKVVDSSDTFGMFLNGSLFLKKSLHWYFQRNYTIMIVANDGGFPPKYTSSLVFISVININSPPSFDVPFYSLSILETVKVGSSLLYIEVTDNDEGNNGNIFLNISKDVESVFEFVGRVLVLKSALNYSLISKYAFTIDAKDGGIPPLQAIPNAIVNLTIYGVSSLQPHFLLSMYKVMDLMEKILYDTPLLTVSAFINGSNLGILYILDGNDSQYFTINNNGSIFSKIVFDYKNQSSYIFEVIAQNSANLSYFDRAVVKLSIKETNDNAPVLLPLMYNFNVSKRSPVGTIIGRINATDQGTTNNKLVYSLFNTTNNLFILIGDLLVVNAPLDSSLQTDYQFYVYATDAGVPPLNSALGNIMIHLFTPFSGLPPVFESNLYVVNVFNNITTNDTILNVKAQLDQSTGNTISYSLDSSTDALSFKIDSITGDISLKPGFRFSNLLRRTLAFYAIATDLLGFSDRTFVIINIIDSSGIDHTRPVFTQEEYMTSISESISIGSTVVTVQAIDIDSVMLTYSILSGNNLNSFYITSNGAVVVNNYLDISTSGVNCYVLKVSAKDELNKTSVKSAIVTINIVPSNQTVNYLFFENSTYLFSIPENTTMQKIGSVMAQISNGKQEYVQYKVLGLNSLFEMKGADLWSMQVFDREQIDRYVFQIFAYSNISSFDKAVVIVDILDINDNVPVFSDTPIISIVLSEFSQVSSIVATVKATDDDIGVNGEVNYDLFANDFFSIDKYGQISLTKSFTHNTPDIINITVTASNPDSFNLSSSMLLTAYVIKEQVPQFDNTTYYISLSETNNSAIIFTLTALSPEIVNYSMNPGRDNSVFEITPSGQLKNILPIDYELNKYFDLCVQAHGRSIIMSSVNIHIDVLDINDNSPVSEKSYYEVNVTESSLLKTQIVTIFANDLDTGINGELVYEIKDGNINNTFLINNEGVITLTNFLDSKINPMYLLKVMIYDNGVPRLNTTVQVKVNVVKFEDVLFELSASDYNITVNESTSKQYITNVFVKNSTGLFIMYSLIDYSDVFTINETGQIWSKSGLSNATQSKYVIVVMAVANDRSSYIQIIVNIRRFNHKPFITEISPFSVSRKAPINTLVARVIAQDLDSHLSPNGILDYSIISGNDNNIFTIDKNGYVLTQKLLTIQQTGLYNLSIVVSDNGTPKLSSDTRNVTIKVSNGVLVFSNSSYLYNFPENSNISISDIVATGLDIGDNISYSIEPLEAQMWFLFGLGNKIYPRKVLDYETWQEFSFIVVATSSSYEAKAVVTIQLTNVNDNTPVFYPTNYMVNIPINTTAKTNITSVYASDSDKNTVLVFSLIDNTNTFSIDSSGVISTKKELNYSTTVYNLLVNVSDNEKSAAIPAHVAVYVQFFPVTFDQQLYRFTPQKNSANMTLGTVHATSDVEISYSLDGYNNQFTIDQNSGEIRITQNFDQKYYFFVVIASTQYTNVSVAVIVIVNLPPKFDDTPNEITLPVNWPVDVEITVIKASNPENFASIKYTLDNTSTFSIDNNTGSLTLNRPVTTAASYTLTVVAEIQNSHNFNANKTLKVVFASLILDSINVQAISAPNAEYINVNVDLDDFFSNQTWKQFKTLNVYVQKFKQGISERVAYLPPLTWFLTNVALDGTDDYYKTYLALVVNNNQFTRKRRDISADGKLQLTIGNETCSVQNDPQIPCNGKLQPGQTYRFQLVGVKDKIKTATPFSKVLYSGISSSLPFYLSGTSLYYIIGLVVLGSIIVLLIILLAFAALLYTSHQVPGYENINHDKVDGGIDWPINKYNSAESYIPRATRVDNPLYSTKPSTFTQNNDPNFDEVDSIPRASYKPQNPVQLETQEIQISLARSNDRQSVYLSGKGEPEDSQIPQAPPPPALFNQRLTNTNYNETTRSTAQPKLARTSSGRVILQQ